MASKHSILAWQGDIRVLDALIERKKNIDEGKIQNADGRTIGILFNGGGQRGVLFGGIALALEEAGLTDMFDHVIGYSTGALCAWYFCAGESSKAATMYYKEGVEDNYIRQLHPWKIVDLNVVGRIMRKEQPIDINRLRAFPGKIHIGLTNAQTGKGTFVDPRTFKDPLAPVITSCALPFLDGKLSMELEGKRYVDGGIAWPLPVRYCAGMLHCTDLLILMTHPLQKAHETFIDTLGNIGVQFFYSSSFTKKFRTVLQRYNEGIEYLIGSSHGGSTAKHVQARICTLYPEHISFSVFSENKTKLKEAEQASKEFARNLLASRMKRLRD